MENTNKILSLKDNEQILKYEEQIYELRKDGVHACDLIGDRIREVKKNKMIEDSQKEAMILDLKEQLVKAKEIKTQNAEELKALIKEAKAYAKSVANPEYKRVQEIEKANRVEYKEEFKQEIAKAKQEHLDRLAGIDKTDKIALQKEKAFYASVVFDIKKAYTDKVQASKTVVYDIHNELYNELNLFGGGKVNFIEGKEHAVKEYIYRFNLKDFLLKNGLYLIIALFFIVCLIITPIVTNGRTNLFALEHLFAILEQSATPIFYALGVAGLILLAGTDLSIGRMVGLGAVITGVILHKGDNIVQFFGLGAWNFDAVPMALRVIMALGLSILFCTLFSALAGFFSAKFKMHPFITTLSTQLIIYGLLYYATKGTPVGPMDQGIQEAIGGLIYIGGYGFPKIFLYAVVAIIVVSFIWNKTKFGKNMYAVGGNPEAASVSGISVFWTTLLVFIMAGILYGFGSFFESFRANASAGTGYGFELNAIAACVVGGISFSGGIGKIRGAVLGVFIFTGLTYCLTVLGVDTNLQFVLKGVIIMTAVALDCAKYLKKK